MDTPTTVALEDADFPSLKHYASVILGLELKTGANSNTVRAMIKTVAPETTHIPSAAAATAPQAEPATAPASAPVAKRAPVYSLLNPHSDPKVELTVNKTAETWRAKEVTVLVNDTVWRMQRGEKVKVPYRVYLALNNAIEKTAVLSDRESKFGLPQYDYEDVHSYPFTVHEMPSQGEIDAWLAATGGSELKAA